MYYFRLLGVAKLAFSFMRGKEPKLRFRHEVLTSKKEMQIIWRHIFLAYRNVCIQLGHDVGSAVQLFATDRPEVQVNQ